MPLKTHVTVFSEWWLIINSSMIFEICLFCMYQKNTKRYKKVYDWIKDLLITFSILRNLSRHYFILKTSRLRLFLYFPKSLKHFRSDAFFLAILRRIHLTPLGVFGCLSHQFFPKKSWFSTRARINNHYYARNSFITYFEWINFITGLFCLDFEKNKIRMSDYHLLADATPLTQANKLELGFRQLRKTVERKLGKKEDPAIVKVQSELLI